jgi:hypothetical protein
MAELNPKKRLNQEQRDEITRRVLAGEKAPQLAEEFGVSRAYVSLLKNQAIDPERFQHQAEDKFAKKFTKAEREKIIGIVSTSTPEEQVLIPTREHWSLDHGFQLVWRLYQKKPSVRAMKELMEPYIPRREDYRFPKPKPPKPHHVNQLDPELAKDPEFVAYYLSPICQQIAQREYEAALADWEKRFAADEERATVAAEAAGSFAEAPPVLAPGLRVGKHAKSKGRPFTPPKRRKKRR